MSVTYPECVVLLSRFLLLWSAVLIMYPTTLAVIALTFSNYVLQPVFPYCIPPFIATRMLSAICICECLLFYSCIGFISLNSLLFKEKFIYFEMALVNPRIWQNLTLGLK